MGLPNQITLARFVISLILFGVLSYVPSHCSLNADAALSSSSIILLDVALTLFLIASLSDYLDGYFARKYNMISTFGRIADPFVDKILTCGAFIFLMRVTPLVHPWMVVIIISREMLVSTLRSYMEGQKIAFGAQRAGKFKMVLQCFAISFLLFYVAHLQHISIYIDISMLVLLWLTVIVTIASMTGYIQKSYEILKKI